MTNSVTWDKVHPRTRQCAPEVRPAVTESARPGLPFSQSHNSLTHCHRHMSVPNVCVSQNRAHTLNYAHTRSCRLSTSPTCPLAPGTKLNLLPVYWPTECESVPTCRVRRSRCRVEGGSVAVCAVRVSPTTARAHRYFDNLSAFAKHSWGF